MSRFHTLWRFIYHSLYYFLALILTLLLCVTPADALRQSILNRQRYHILTIIVCLSVAIFSVACIYIFRFYVTRTALASIPKPYIPIEKGELPGDVRQVIVAGLSKSALIAYESKPRVTANTRPVTTDTREGGEEEGHGARNDAAKKKFGIFGRSNKAESKPAASFEKTGVTLPPRKAVWGEIEHNGWASPNSPDLPNLQYSTVVSELPNLIEAKALTLAPSAPGSSPQRQGNINNDLLDPDAIALLQRPENLSLRQYLAQLAELGVLQASRTTAEFLASYEYARYSTRPLSNRRFRELMHLFAEILRAMQPLDPDVLAAGFDDDDRDADEDNASEYLTTTTGTAESDIDDDAPRESPSTPRSRASQHPYFAQRHPSNSSRATTTTSSSTSGSWRRDDHDEENGASPQIYNHYNNLVNSRRQRPNLTLRQSSQGTWTGTYRTAPMTPGSSRMTVGSPISLLSSSSSSSVNSFRPAQPSHAATSRRSLASSSSGGGVSMRSVNFGGALSRASASGSGSWNGSVIRLNDHAGVGELPYVFSVPRQ